MFGRSLYNLLAQDLGLSMKNVLIVEFEPGPEMAGVSGEIFTNAIDQITSMPGVEAVTPIASLPFDGFNVNTQTVASDVTGTIVKSFPTVQPQLNSTNFSLLA